MKKYQKPHIKIVSFFVEKGFSTSCTNPHHNHGNGNGHDNHGNDNGNGHNDNSHNDWGHSW